MGAVLWHQRLVIPGFIMSVRCKQPRKMGRSSTAVPALVGLDLFVELHAHLALIIEGVNPSYRHHAHVHERCRDAIAADPVHLHTWNPRMHGFLVATTAIVGTSLVRTQPPPATASSTARPHATHRRTV